VNHDGNMNIVDVTELIDTLMGAATDVCDICADVDGNGIINITDVTDLIDMLFSGN
jgi:hypothetical protein